MNAPTNSTAIPGLTQANRSMPVCDAIDNMDYDFTANSEGAATIEETEILDHDVTDSR